MIASSPGGRVHRFAGSLLVAVAVVGCSSRANRPAASHSMLPSEVAVPGAIEELSVSAEPILGSASTSAVRAKTAAAREPRPDVSATVAAIETEPADDLDGIAQCDPRSTDQGCVRLTAAEDASLHPVRLLAAEVELADGVSESTSTDAENIDPPLPEPIPAGPESNERDLDPAIFQNQIPIDLASALQIAAGVNPQVGFAQQRIREAYAQLQLAEVLWVPSIRAGVNYNKHDGVIQDVAGNMVTNSRSSVYTGLGAQAVGAGSPAVPGLLMNFHLRDAIFNPRIADQALGARRQASRAVANDALLETALRYTDLLQAIQVLAIAEESLKNAEQLSELTKSFAEAGQGLEADADRALAELSIRQIERQRAVEDVRVASIGLGRVLSQRDLSLTLVPQEPALIPIDLVFPTDDIAELVATGLSNRPELAASRYLVGEAVELLRREAHAPLVPSVLLGLSYGGNGGSPNSTIRDFGDRVDFDAVAYWEVRNLGLGERFARDASRSQLEQARWRQVQVMDQVASEVAEAHAQVEARQSQIRLAETGILAAERSYRRNSERIRDGQGLPIEALQSIQALDQARRQYVRTVADYNRAQFQLQRALGWPIE